MLKLREGAVAWTEVEGETLLLDLKRSVYLSTNASATVLWRHLVAGTTEAELVAALVSEYDIDATTATADVEEFLDDCRGRSLLE